MADPGSELNGCFPELGGFVVLDLQRLEAELPGAEGSDLFAMFGAGAVGDRVTSAGIAVPILGVSIGYYTIVLRDSRSRPRWRNPVCSSHGWVVGTQTGELLVTGAGYLTEWNQRHDQHRAVTVPPGWYRLTITGYLLEPDSDDDYGLDLELTRAATPPPFTADLTRLFSFEEPR
ncbi:hypothetical protein [Mycobacterium deserti]|uniref:DUF985 domain-containing protein n=1 Tax=Mycobacterium deserti TaxID=2978347 RepID=A0ABT2M9Z3_9MYCO|nr:hypothetical protein [Mycobacterium deserti]MCT7659088.1 hypothetical protein [Mycobacterium deserti]